eukprot:TRINITY_DN38035_c0_g1_i2.p1 TRINITY_DN38035_c0_g1~~TRINITY_DN38035_c0_g1_i2.p1  ORF type:complete len:412 (+),score=64.27 TRINITY_DN38035_c0_g1_i2:47-1282(+)
MSNYAHHQILAMDLEDSSSGEDTRTNSAWASPGWARAALLGLAGFGVVCIASAAVVATVARTQNRLPMQSVSSARSLLESPEMIDETTKNFVAWNGVQEKDEPALRHAVSRNLAKVTAKIRSESPEAFRRLEARQLSAGEKADTLKVVAGLRHPGLQSLGRELAEAVHASRYSGRDSLKQSIQAKFASNVPMWRQLHDEFFPASLRRVASDADNSQLNLNVDKLRIVKEFPDSWNVVASREKRRLSTSSSSTSATSSANKDISEDPKGKGSILQGADIDKLSYQFEEALGILAGLLEQTRVALDQVDSVGESFGHDMKIPYWAKSAVGGLDFVAELSDCVMRADSNQVKLVMCPMKYASAAADFLESIDNILGVDNGKFFHGSSLPPAVQVQNANQFSQGYGQATNNIWAR